MKTRSLERFFTLIELMIVVAIIAVLAGLLLPALKTARDQAKDSCCKSQLKQIGLGVMGYVMDNNNWYPQKTYDAGGNLVNWPLLIADYVGFSETKGPPLFHCPVGRIFLGKEATPWLSMGYDMNRYVGTNYLNNGNLNKIPTPSILGVIFDNKYTLTSIVSTVGAYENCEFYLPGKYGTDMRVAGYLWANYAFRHPGLKLNLIFGDGHVAASRQGHNLFPSGKIVYEWWGTKVYYFEDCSYTPPP